MTNAMTAGLTPTHPGEILREDILPAIRNSRADVARLLGISRQHLYDVLNEKKPVTPRMALRLGRMFGNTPDFWLRLQQEYDLRTLASAMADELAAIPVLEVA